MFSSPAPIALGETNFSVIKKANKGEDGKPICGLPNIKTNKSILYKTPDSRFFSRPSYTTLGDPFKATGLMALRNNKEEFLVGGHDRDFKPMSNVKERLHRAPYPYRTEGPPSPREIKDEDGRVITKEPNIKTGPMKKGKVGKGVTLGGKIEYIADDYNIKKKIATEEREYHMSKVQDAPFSQRARKKDLFWSHKQTYMEDPPVPAREVPKKEVEAYDHDRAMRLGGKGKSGHSGAFEKYPEYMPNPIHEVKRKVVDEDEEEMPGFKYPTKGFSRPTPSIQLNLRNLKSQYPSAFNSFRSLRSTSPQSAR